MCFLTGPKPSLLGKPVGLLWQGFVFKENPYVKTSLQHPTDWGTQPIIQGPHKFCTAGTLLHHFDCTFHPNPLSRMNAPVGL